MRHRALTLLTVFPSIGEMGERQILFRAGIFRGGFPTLWFVQAGSSSPPRRVLTVTNPLLRSVFVVCHFAR